LLGFKYTNTEELPMPSSTDQPTETSAEQPTPAPAPRCGVCATIPAAVVARNTCPNEAR
jgi:hypothetical protein